MPPSQDLVGTHSGDVSSPSMIHSQWTPQAGTAAESPSSLMFSVLLQVAAINPDHPLAQMPLPPSMKNCIQLAACEATELLPMVPDLPADLFTSCLTTPIKIALRW